MTLILNILHKDISVLAADRKAIAHSSITTAPGIAIHSGGDSIVHNYKKITLNSNASLALGIAGLTQDHPYIYSIQRSDSIDEGLKTIRAHMECFLQLYERNSLRTLTTFTANEVVASFFDQNEDKYFTTTFRFSAVENWTRLRRGTDEANVLYAGSGSKYFKTEEGEADMKSFIASTKNSCTLQACISWAQDVYKKVGAIDDGTGAEVVFAASTRSNPKFCFVDGC